MRRRCARRTLRCVADGLSFCEETSNLLRHLGRLETKENDEEMYAVSSVSSNLSLQHVTKLWRAYRKPCTGRRVPFCYLAHLKDDSPLRLSNPRRLETTFSTFSVSDFPIRLLLRSTCLRLEFCPRAAMNSLSQVGMEEQDSADSFGCVIDMFCGFLVPRGQSSLASSTRGIRR